MRITGLFSGSSGNCVLFENDGVKLLIDAGMSAKAIFGALDEVEVSPSEIDGILITHEHDDHTKGVGILSRKLDIPVYANEKTMHASLSKLGKMKEENMIIFDTNSPFEIKGVEIMPFSVNHDAKDPVGYSFYDGKDKISLATDTGIITSDILANLRGSKCAFVESNHDIQMLKNGPYPMHLKKRILGNEGHLSNDSAGKLCEELIQSGTENIILGHLSRHNNTPLVALNTVVGYLEKAGIRRGKDYVLNIALHDKVSESMDTKKIL